MRTQLRHKQSVLREREDRLRAGRAAAQTLRSVSPTAMSVNVQLRFLVAATPAHATQSFVLYPAAKAYFAYPCPYGDCSGIYNLDLEAARAMGREKSRVTGTVDCAGVRSHAGQPRGRCGLQMRYVITAKHDAQRDVESIAHASSTD
jgi:hypothetical protein